MMTTVPNKWRNVKNLLAENFLSVQWLITEKIAIGYKC